jgi:hypothetical protein
VADVRSVLLVSAEMVLRCLVDAILNLCLPSVVADEHVNEVCASAISQCRAVSLLVFNLVAANINLSVTIV